MSNKLPFPLITIEQLAKDTKEGYRTWSSIDTVLGKRYDTIVYVPGTQKKVVIQFYDVDEPYIVTMFYFSTNVSMYFERLKYKDYAEKLDKLGAELRIKDRNLLS